MTKFKKIKVSKIVSKIVCGFAFAATWGAFLLWTKLCHPEHAECIFKEPSLALLFTVSVLASIVAGSVYSWTKKFFK